MRFLPNLFYYRRTVFPYGSWGNTPGYGGDRHDSGKKIVRQLAPG